MSSVEPFVNRYLVYDYDNCIPKQDVWDKYFEYCNKYDLEIISRNIFSKHLKDYIPRVRIGFTGGRRNRIPAFWNVTWKGV